KGAAFRGRLVVAGVAGVAAEMAVDERKLLSAAIAWMGRPSIDRLGRPERGWLRFGKVSAGIFSKRPETRNIPHIASYGRIRLPEGSAKGEERAQADRCPGCRERNSGRGRADPSRRGGHRGFFLRGGLLRSGLFLRAYHLGEMLGSGPGEGERAVRLPEGPAGLQASEGRQDLARRLAHQAHLARVPVPGHHPDESRRSRGVGAQPERIPDSCPPAG